MDWALIGQRSTKHKFGMIKGESDSLIIQVTYTQFIRVKPERSLRRRSYTHAQARISMQAYAGNRFLTAIKYLPH